MPASKEQNALYVKAWRARHPETKKAQNAKYYAEKKTEILRKKRERYAAKRAALIASGEIIPRTRQTPEEKKVKARAYYLRKKAERLAPQPQDD